MTNKKQRLFISALFMSVIGGCASLHTEVYENIHEGDSRSSVIEVLGEPDRFGPSESVPGASKMIYVRRKDVCAILIQNEKVLGIACDRNMAYVNPAAAVLKGIGDGLSNANRNSINCTTTGENGYYNTNCH